MVRGSTSKVSQTVSFFDNYGQAIINLPSPAPSKGHQRSRTTTDLPPLFSRTSSSSTGRSSIFMPFGNRSREPSPKSLPLQEPAEARLFVHDTQRKLKPGPMDKITSWFEGASEPVNITLIPSPKKEDLISVPLSSTEDPSCDNQAIYSRESLVNNEPSMDNMTQRPCKTNPAEPSAMNGSRFNFFKWTSTPTTKPDPEDLAQIDVRKALLSSEDAEEMTSVAFKNLQVRAEALLKKFQTSYAENLRAMRRLTSDNEVLTDELEAARTRNEHLRSQLLEMAEKASDQEKLTASLQSQLNNPQPSVRMIVDDDQVPSTRRSRKSWTSHVSSSDESFVDSDASSAVSSAASVFSEFESVRTPSTPVTASLTMKHASSHSPTVVQGPAVHAQGTPVLVTQCQNCLNMSASEAWNLVEMMKMESACLKQRITELEAANDSALDFLATLRI